MRVAFISDLHSNAVALSSVLDVLDSVDRVVCLGDMIGYYCQINEVIEILRRYEPLCIMGNHDYYLFHGCSPRAGESVRWGIEYADKVITADYRAWLGQLPLVWGGEIASLSCLLFHGSPWKPIDDYLYPDSDLLPKLDEFRYDVLAFGQTHRPIVRTDKRPFLINPGSIGQSRQPELFGKACAAVLDTTTLSVERIERPYDMSAVTEQAMQNGAGSWARKFMPIPAVS